MRLHYVVRRVELLAELFLQELAPVSLGRASDDFVVGFENPRGGTNNFIVVVKSSERVMGDRFEVPAEVYRRWANSSPPVLLLVADVKRNDFYFAWPSPEFASDSPTRSVSVNLAKIDDESRQTRLATL